MKEHIAFLISIGAQHSFTEYTESRTLQYSCQYAILVIAEAANHLPPAVRNRAADVPWPAIISIGNKLRHEYHRVDPVVIWDIITNHLDRLDAAVALLLDMPDVT